ncbi:MAG: DUF3592 domain-containing protein [Thermoguttaceae bacterium]
MKKENKTLVIIIAVIFTLSFGLLSCFFGVKFILPLAKQFQVVSYLETQGKITTCELKNVEKNGEATSQLHIEYRYEVGDAEYVGDTFSYDFPVDRSESYGSVIKNFPVGKEVSVYYSPDDPQKSVLTKSFCVYNVEMFHFALAFFACALFALYILIHITLKAWYPNRWIGNYVYYMRRTQKCIRLFYVDSVLTALMVSAGFGVVTNVIPKLLKASDNIILAVTMLILSYVIVPSITVLLSFLYNIFVDNTMVLDAETGQLHLPPRRFIAARPARCISVCDIIEFSINLVESDIKVNGNNRSDLTVKYTTEGGLDKKDKPQTNVNKSGSQPGVNKQLGSDVTTKLTKTDVIICGYENIDGVIKLKEWLEAECKVETTKIPCPEIRFPNDNLDAGQKLFAAIAFDKSIRTQLKTRLPGVKYIQPQISAQRKYDKSGSGVGAVFVMVPVIIFLLIWSGLSAGFDYYMIKTLVRQYHTSGYVQTSGVIIKSGVADNGRIKDKDGSKKVYEPEIEYTYEVDGKAYTGTKYTHAISSDSDKESVEKIINALPAGGDVTVYYDPKEPQNAVLSKEDTAANYMLPLIFMVPFHLIPILGFYYIIKYVIIARSKSKSRWDGNSRKEVQQTVKQRRTKKRWVGAAYIVDEGETDTGFSDIRLKFPGNDPIILGGIAWGAACFVSVFTCGFVFRDSIPGTLVTACLCLLAGVITFVYVLVKNKTSSNEWVIDTVKKTFTYPAPKIKRYSIGADNTVTVPFSRILGFDVLEVADKYADTDYHKVTLYMYNAEGSVTIAEENVDELVRTARITDLLANNFAYQNEMLEMQDWLDTNCR